MIWLDKDYIITKSNKLIACNYDLSLQEQKIILTLASMVQPQDTEFKEYEFKIKEFIELLGLKDQSKYKEVPKITKDLMKKVFEIKEGKDTIQLAWLSSARYRTGEGTIVLKFDSNLKPYMLELKELYTSYKIHNVLSLKSKYSIRIYEILKSNLFKKQVIIELEELKNMVGANEKAYNIYNNVKNRILTQAQNELKDRTDISFNFEEIKIGRKVKSIKFNISSNTKPKAINEVAVTVVADPHDQELIKQVLAIFINHKITVSEASYILKDANSNIDLIKQCYEYASNKNIKNITGYIRTLVKGFNEPQENIKTDTFNNYDQRVYNFAELEEVLLGQKNIEDANIYS